MEYTRTITCYKCLRTNTMLNVASPPKFTEPSEWSVVTVTGHPIINRSLCPDCAHGVRRFLDGVQ